MFAKIPAQFSVCVQTMKLNVNNFCKFKVGPVLKTMSCILTTTNSLSIIIDKKKASLDQKDLSRKTEFLFGPAFEDVL